MTTTTTTAPLNIEVYSTPRCSACNFTKKTLDTKGVPYTEVPMDQEKIVWAKEQYGIMQAPLVLVKNRQGEVIRHWSGGNMAAVLEVAQEYLRDVEDGAAKSA